MGTKLQIVAVLGVACAVAATAADRGLSFTGTVPLQKEASYLLREVANSVRQSGGTTYHHVWPPMKFGWEIVLGSFIGFFGAALGSIGGLGGGGIFVPMLILIIGFDPKSSAAMSKCMIMGTAVSTVYCNLKVKHPTFDMPVIDYDLALLIQPMLMLGVSIGVICNVVFPDWLVTVLLIILCIVTSTKAFLKGVETWKKETIIKREEAKQSEQTCEEEQEYMALSAGPDAASQTETLPVQDHYRNNETPSAEAVSIWKNVYWKEVGLLAFVWVAFLALQVTKNYMATCSMWYWVLNLLQIPVSVGVAMYEAVCLVQGKRMISSNTNEQTSLKARQLLVYCFLGVTAGVVAGMLGVGGGAIMGPLFLELGVPPQVSSATATFAMMFSSSMSVVEYFLLNRFPVPYALFFTTLAFFAAIVGQRVARKLIGLLGRASLIIFILSFTIFISALSLGGVGISNAIHKIVQHEYMGFDNICKYDA
ncbi:sulfite exporter TauE/SafE family protein 3-like isoform X2 [Lolium rigidum]|uniref:sulfite exporter TauE/SafE family protein 3-like isoform X2 n=1 Tax=Lolium rigidum TaxID=89674 RepID=UPI001F5DD0C3|nr:sulfite exporter TauE/SafE family protein 3-like isoform X2 [Lolium rigidum]